jgi:hypothetical protein
MPTNERKWWSHEMDPRCFKRLHRSLRDIDERWQVTLDITLDIHPSVSNDWTLLRYGDGE